MQVDLEQKTQIDLSTSENKSLLNVTCSTLLSIHLYIYTFLFLLVLHNILNLCKVFYYRPYSHIFSIQTIAKKETLFLNESIFIYLHAFLKDCN